MSSSGASAAPEGGAGRPAVVEPTPQLDADRPAHADDVASVRAIVGPTGSGKTALALALAGHLGRDTPIVVINADSRQVYAHFAIGTAAPTAHERARLPHALVGTVSPFERFTAAQWAAAAAMAIDVARARGAIPLLVGGTGFYLRALAAPLFEEPPLDPVRRDALRQRLRRWSHDEVTRWAAALDPSGGGPGRAQRERAIELALLTGRSRSAWHQAAVSASAGRALRYLALDAPTSLPARLERRLTAMLAAGWLDEVRTAVAQVPAEAPAWQACGYLALREVVTAGAPLPAALDRVRIETRQYVKRQRTWFRHQLRDGPVTRLDADQPDLLPRALEWWHGAEASPSSS